MQVVPEGSQQQQYEYESDETAMASDHEKHESMRNEEDEHADTRSTATFGFCQIA